MKLTRRDHRRKPLLRLAGALAFASVLIGRGTTPASPSLVTALGQPVPGMLPASTRGASEPVLVSGMKVEVRAGRAVVTEVAPGSAAAAAGILPLDTILVVNELNLIDLNPVSPAKVMDLFRHGQVGGFRLIIGRGAGTLGVHLPVRPAGGSAVTPKDVAIAPGLGRLGPGTEAPVFTGADLNGGKVSLLDLRGRPVLISFWASWCAPCRDSAITLRRLAVEYAGRLTIVGVSLDEDRRAYEAYVHNRHLPGQQIFDGGWLGPIGRLYDVASAGVPYSVLIDPSGRIVSMGTSLRDQEEALVRLTAAPGPSPPPLNRRRGPR